MKILSIGNFGHGWDGSICDEEHIAHALEDLGHQVVRLQREEIGAATGLPWVGVDIILIAQWDGYGDSEIELLATSKKVYEHYGHKNLLVYWAFDYQNDGQEWHEKLVAASDLYLSKRIADSQYDNWQWLSQDFAPSFLGHRMEVEQTIDVLFTGSYLDWATERNETIQAVNEKYNLTVHSVNDWPFLERQPPIMDEGLTELYSRAKVILSIDHTIEAGYWSDRNAQIMACGRRPLFRYIPLSEARFGDRVDYFYNVEDCLKKIGKRLAEAEKPTNASGLYVTDRVKDLLTIVNAHLTI